MRKGHMTVLGAGLSGALLSTLLAQKGYQVQLFEKRSDPRKSGLEEGRSINLALSHRGWSALEQAGLREKVHDQAIAMQGRMMHSKTGQLSFQPYGTEEQAIYSVSRSGLNQLLIEEAEKAGAELLFQYRCEEIYLDRGEALIHSLENKTNVLTQPDLLIGADGAYSTLRTAMQKTPRYNYSQSYIEHGYKELSIPAKNGEFAIEPNALHIWPRGGYMLIALPNADKSFTCTLFLAYEGKESFAKLNSPADVTRFFETQFPDALAVMPELTEDFFQNPTSDLVTIKCFPWSRYGKNVLIGDAAHAIVPFYGQGMNAGFEDCRIFMDLLAECNHDYAQMVQQFQSLRKPDADAVATLALQNFIEMRDLVADREFLERKKIEAELHRRFPDRWVPLYTMVTFTNIRYSEALRIGQQQDQIMRKVMKHYDYASELTDQDYERIVSLMTND
ncbi:FAD-dependent oxidoreductase [Tunicatimonas pelagia]|uniref:FAD-dependent oxidoreductase n=1 Tax=Tunicatimonas pelagia TaxID=931531 RepID=UPI002665C89E|nr:NAD(P)/FAD-dependent oxidoreductase [Tunicatimonas pelagia]WKN44592.1 NAD(P)/FAD-dependent oxidoreductase [Tunicatimonas pelagia]